MPPNGARERIVLLRRRIAALEARDGPLPGLPAEWGKAGAPASAQDFFETLPGALAPGGLSEIVPARPRDAAAAAGFTSVLALCATAPRAASAVWIAEDMAAREIGLPYAKGLEALGLDPARLIVARTHDPRETLWTMEEALKRRVGAVVAESWIAPGAYGLATSRRLSLAARRGGGCALLLLLRAAGQGGRIASAAQLRFEVGAPSPPRPAPGCGPPLPGPLGWRLRLLKARLGADCPGDLDTPEWRELLFDPNRGAFRHAFPQRLPAEACDRPDLAAKRRAFA